MINIILSNLFSILIAYTFGNIFIYLLFPSKSKIDIFEKILLGFIFYGFSILFLNFFTSINVIINSIFIICSIIFVIFFKKKYLIEISKLIIASSLIVLFLISYSKINDPDAFLYHLPYTQILNEQKIIFGLSNLHFRFGTISLEQYINAGNFNFIKNPGVIISSASIFSIIFMKIFINIYNHLKKLNS